MKHNKHYRQITILVTEIVTHKKTISKIVGLLIIPGGFAILTLWAIKVYYKKPISVLDVVNIVIEGFDAFPKIQNPIQAFVDPGGFPHGFILS